MLPGSEVALFLAALNSELSGHCGCPGKIVAVLEKFESTRPDQDVFALSATVLVCV